MPAFELHKHKHIRSLICYLCRLCVFKTSMPRPNRILAAAMPIFKTVLVHQHASKLAASWLLFCATYLQNQ